jgi:hypothetical protein
MLAKGKNKRGKLRQRGEKILRRKMYRKSNDQNNSKSKMLIFLCI